MRKFAAFLCVLLMAVSLAACVGNGKSEEAVSEGTAEASDMSADSGEVTESTESMETEAASDKADGSSEIGNNDTERKTKILVAYFSATNTTKGVAENIAEGLGGDLYEIVPETPYTDADLDYNDDNSRSTIEMNDPDARPAIAGTVSDMQQYDIVFIGYPIWWGQAPRILNTFVEGYDFSGKTIVPFCTSGGSGIGSSDSNLAALTKGAKWLPGMRFSGGSSSQEIMEWVESLGLNIE